MTVIAVIFVVICAFAGMWIGIFIGVGKIVFSIIRGIWNLFDKHFHMNAKIKEWNDRGLFTQAGRKAARAERRAARKVGK